MTIPTSRAPRSAAPPWRLLAAVTAVIVALGALVGYAPAALAGGGHGGGPNPKTKTTTRTVESAPDCSARTVEIVTYTTTWEFKRGKWVEVSEKVTDRSTRPAKVPGECAYTPRTPYTPTVTRTCLSVTWAHGDVVNEALGDVASYAYRVGGVMYPYTPGTPVTFTQPGVVIDLVVTYKGGFTHQYGQTRLGAFEDCGPEPEPVTSSTETLVCAEGTWRTAHFEATSTLTETGWTLGEPVLVETTTRPATAEDCGLTPEVREKVTVRCEAGKSRVFTDFYVREWTFDSNEWVLGPERWTHKDVRDATEEECPAAPEPTEEPTEDPTPTEEPTSTPTTPETPETPEPGDEPTEPEPSEQPTQQPEPQPEPSEPTSGPPTPEPSEEPSTPAPSADPVDVPDVPAPSGPGDVDHPVCEPGSSPECDAGDVCAVEPDHCPLAHEPTVEPTSKVGEPLGPVERDTLPVTGGRVATLTALASLALAAGVILTVAAVRRRGAEA